MVRFILDGERVELDRPNPTLTLLELLRGPLSKTGTKEGCAEGDCGACTVLVGDLEGSTVRWRAVCACILFVPMLDGRAVLTVEGLEREGALHPVQLAMVELHGSQCGFCTPGIVMSLYGRAIGARGSEATAADVLAGNLCRCTGYGPILAAAEQVPQAERDDRALAAELAELQRDEGLEYTFMDSVRGLERSWHAPRTLDELVGLRARLPEARLVAGATDVGLWVTKGLAELPGLIWVGEIEELRAIEETPEGLRLGAGVRYVDAHAALERIHPELGELVRRIGGLQVRSSGTIGGNIANGSPIGDMPPALIALGAELELRGPGGSRKMPLEDYFVAYGEQRLGADEVVASVWVPRPSASTKVQITKLSKRFDSDISAVCGAIALELDGDGILEARVAFGGMAGTPSRALRCEAALRGAPWSAETIEAAVRALSEDFAPLSDLRGSSSYRTRVAGNLLRKLWRREQGEPVSVLELRA